MRHVFRDRERSAELVDQSVLRRFFPEDYFCGDGVAFDSGTVSDDGAGEISRAVMEHLALKLVVPDVALELSRNVVQRRFQIRKDSISTAVKLRDNFPVALDFELNRWHFIPP
jgi:hypothetical protein